VTQLIEPTSLAHLDLAPANAAPRRDRDVAPVILSFDVEEHHRIEAASGLTIDPALRDHYTARVGETTRWLLDRLAQRDIKATFFVVGQFACEDPALIRSISEAGHEVASHGWDHRRVLEMTPREFREDVRRSKDQLEQITGEEVQGYRAPTFSIVRRTAWALDTLAEQGLLYDSSIYPVRHDRYGVPQAPRTPFLARGLEHTILELPPATLRVGGANFPAGGGGYFRLLPLAVMERAIRQLRRDYRPGAAMLYFHPWEFDPAQQRLPLRPLSQFRTYVGIRRSRGRFNSLLERHRFGRAIDLAEQLSGQRHILPSFAPRR
jgi:polysaccharide deacetylase family protein (PEP-CTERM system associated)